MIKKIVTILGLVTLGIILAGMYKFNYLANQVGYNVDGNKIKEYRLTVSSENKDKGMGENTDSLMTVKIPKLDFGDDEFQISFKEYQVPKSQAVLQATLEKLFQLRGKDGVWNGLKFHSVDLKDGTAKIKLTGDWRPVGDVSSLWFSAEINAAAFQFPTVDKVEVYLNDQIFNWCIDDMSDGEGGCPSDDFDWRENKEDYKYFKF